MAHVLDKLFLDIKMNNDKHYGYVLYLRRLMLWSNAVLRFLQQTRCQSLWLWSIERHVKDTGLCDEAVDDREDPVGVWVVVEGLGEVGIPHVQALRQHLHTIHCDTTCKIQVSFLWNVMIQNNNKIVAYLQKNTVFVPTNKISVQVL